MSGLIRSTIALTVLSSAPGIAAPSARSLASTVAQMARQADLASPQHIGKYLRVHDLQQCLFPHDQNLEGDYFNIGATCRLEKHVTSFRAVSWNRHVSNKSESMFYVRVQFKAEVCPTRSDWELALKTTITTLPVIGVDGGPGSVASVFEVTDVSGRHVVVTIGECDASISEDN